MNFCQCTAHYSNMKVPVAIVFPWRSGLGFFERIPDIFFQSVFIHSAATLELSSFWILFVPFQVAPVLSFAKAYNSIEYPCARYPPISVAGLALLSIDFEIQEQQLIIGKCIAFLYFPTRFVARLFSIVLIYYWVDSSLMRCQSGIGKFQLIIVQLITIMFAVEYQWKCMILACMLMSLIWIGVGKRTS